MFVMLEDLVIRLTQIKSVSLLNGGAHIELLDGTHLKTKTDFAVVKQEIKRVAQKAKR